MSFDIKNLQNGETEALDHGHDRQNLLKLHVDV